jgi:C4-dicarboxylate transporter DctM subunit
VAPRAAHRERASREVRLVIALPFLFLLFLIVIGMPIGFALIVASVATLYWLGLAPITFIPDVLMGSVQSFTLLAIPFFVLTAEIISSGELIDRIFDVARGWFGRLPGGMGTVTTIACAIFGGIQGSSAADAAAIGKIGTQGMAREGWDLGFSGALIASAGSLAILIPPSIAMLIYASLTDASVGRLFFGGVIPGLILVAMFVFYLAFAAKKLSLAPEHVRRYKLAEKLVFTRRAGGILLLPVIVLYGFYTGLLTATEIGTITTVYSLFLALFIHRTLRIRDLWGVFRRSAVTSIKIFIIIAAAILFAKVLTFLQVPNHIVAMVNSAHLSGYEFLLVVSGIMFILGMFMEAVALNVLTTPIFAPIAHSLGIDLIHYGIVVILNIEIALITPPVGLNLFVMSSVTDIKLGELYRKVWPFVVLLIAALLLFIFLPQLTLVLPNLLLGK